MIETINLILYCTTVLKKFHQSLMKVTERIELNQKLLQNDDFKIPAKLHAL